VPDICVEPAGGSRYPSGMESRVAALEQLARVAAASLERIERRFDTGLTHADGRMDRIDRLLDMLWAEQHGNFRWLFGMMFAATAMILVCFLGLLAVLAHGFHWL
jgi:hypothetical protein